MDTYFTNRCQSSQTYIFFLSRDRLGYMKADCHSFFAPSNKASFLLENRHFGICIQYCDAIIFQSFVRVRPHELTILVFNAVNLYQATTDRGGGEKNQMKYSYVNKKMINVYINLGPYISHFLRKWPNYCIKYDVICEIR